MRQFKNFLKILAVYAIIITFILPILSVRADANHNAGKNSSATGESATAIGENANAGGNNSVALGENANATSPGSLAIGVGANASALHAVAIGRSSTATEEQTISFGSADNERRLVNVAAGTSLTDAVNLRQLQIVDSKEAINANKITTNETKIATNTGNIATNTTDIGTLRTDVGTLRTDVNQNAVNIATNTTNIDTNKTDITALDGKVVTNTTDIATNADNIGMNTVDIKTNKTGIKDLGKRMSATEDDTEALYGMVTKNEADIATNTTDIGTNKTDITALDGKVATNTTDIATNAKKQKTHSDSLARRMGGRHDEQTGELIIEYPSGPSIPTESASAESRPASARNLSAPTSSGGTPPTPAAGAPTLNATLQDMWDTMQRNKVTAGENIVVEGSKISVLKNSEFESVKVGAVNINKEGINMGGKKITGLANGGVYQGSSDAMTGDQLWNAYRRIDTVDERVQMVGAHAAALSAMHPVAYNPYEPTTISAGAGFYRNEQSLAVGMFHYVRENLLINAGLAFNSDGDTMGRAGVSFALGKSGKKQPSMVQDMGAVQQQMAAMQEMLLELKEENTKNKETIRELKEALKEKR